MTHIISSKGMDGEVQYIMGLDDLRLTYNLRYVENTQGGRRTYVYNILVELGKHGNTYDEIQISVKTENEMSYKAYLGITKRFIRTLDKLNETIAFKELEDILLKQLEEDENILRW